MARTIAAQPAPNKKTTAKVVPTVDLAKLAAGVKVAPELPKQARNGRAGAVNPFVESVQRSWDEEIALSTPKIPNDETIIKSVHVSIRRAAQQLGVGVSIRNVEQSDGSVVITYQSKERSVRKES